MANETGIRKNLGNFQSLIACCASYNEKYNPGNLDLSLDGLRDVLERTGNLVEVETGLKKALQDVVNERAAEFDGIGRLSGRILNAMVSSGIDAAKVEDANFYHRKLNGRRAGNRKSDKDNTAEPEGESAKGNTHSVSQQGFDDKIGHLSNLIATLKTTELYRPNEPDLTLLALEGKLQGMRNVNSRAKEAQAAWQQALIQRNEAFNSEESGIVKVANLVKSYVKSIFTAGSPQYKQLSNLEFRKITG